VWKYLGKINDIYWTEKEYQDKETGLMKEYKAWNIELKNENFKSSYDRYITLQMLQEVGDKLGFRTDLKTDDKRDAFKKASEVEILVRLASYQGSMKVIPEKMTIIK